MSHRGVPEERIGAPAATTEGTTDQMAQTRRVDKKSRDRCGATQSEQHARLLSLHASTIKKFISLLCALLLPILLAVLIFAPPPPPRRTALFAGFVTGVVADDAPLPAPPLGPLPPGLHATTDADSSHRIHCGTGDDVVVGTPQHFPANFSAEQGCVIRGAGGPAADQFVDIIYFYVGLSWRSNNYSAASPRPAFPPPITGGASSSSYLEGGVLSLGSRQIAFDGASIENVQIYISTFFLMDPNEPASSGLPRPRRTYPEDTAEGRATLPADALMSLYSPLTFRLVNSNVTMTRGLWSTWLSFNGVRLPVNSSITISNCTLVMRTQALKTAFFSAIDFTIVRFTNNTRLVLTNTSWVFDSVCHNTQGPQMLLYAVTLYAFSGINVEEAMPIVAVDASSAIAVVGNEVSVAAYEYPGLDRLDVEFYFFATLASMNLRGDVRGGEEGAVRQSSELGLVSTVLLPRRDEADFFTWWKDGAEGGRGEGANLRHVTVGYPSVALVGGSAGAATAKLGSVAAHPRTPLPYRLHVANNSLYANATEAFKRIKFGLFYAMMSLCLRDGALAALTGNTIEAMNGGSVHVARVGRALIVLAPDPNVCVSAAGTFNGASEMGGGGSAPPTSRCLSRLAFVPQLVPSSPMSSDDTSDSHNADDTFANEGGVGGGGEGPDYGAYARFKTANAAGGGSSTDGDGGFGALRYANIFANASLLTPSGNETPAPFAAVEEPSLRLSAAAHSAFVVEGNNITLTLRGSGTATPPDPATAPIFSAAALHLEAGAQVFGIGSGAVAALVRRNTVLLVATTLHEAAEELMFANTIVGAFVSLWIGHVRLEGGAQLIVEENAVASDGPVTGSRGNAESYVALRCAFVIYFSTQPMVISSSLTDSTLAAVLVHAPMILVGFEQIGNASTYPQSLNVTVLRARDTKPSQTSPPLSSSGGGSSSSTSLATSILFGNVSVPTTTALLVQRNIVTVTSMRAFGARGGSDLFMGALYIIGLSELNVIGGGWGPVRIPNAPLFPIALMTGGSSQRSVYAPIGTVEGVGTAQRRSGGPSDDAGLLTHHRAFLHVAANTVLASTKGSSLGVTFAAFISGVTKTTVRTTPTIGLSWLARGYANASDPSNAAVEAEAEGKREDEEGRGANSIRTLALPTNLLATISVQSNRNFHTARHPSRFFSEFYSIRDAGFSSCYGLAIKGGDVAVESNVTGYSEAVAAALRSSGASPSVGNSNGGGDTHKEPLLLQVPIAPSAAIVVAHNVITSNTSQSYGSVSVAAHFESFSLFRVASVVTSSSSSAASDGCANAVVDGPNPTGDSSSAHAVLLRRALGLAAGGNFPTATQWGSLAAFAPARFPSRIVIVNNSVAMFVGGAMRTDDYLKSNVFPDTAAVVLLNAVGNAASGAIDLSGGGALLVAANALMGGIVDGLVDGIGVRRGIVGYTVNLVNISNPFFTSILAVISDPTRPLTDNSPRQPVAVSIAANSSIIVHGNVVAIRRPVDTIDVAFMNGLVTLRHARFSFDGTSGYDGGAAGGGGSSGHAHMYTHHDQANISSPFSAATAAAFGGGRSSLSGAAHGLFRSISLPPLSIQRNSILLFDEANDLSGGADDGHLRECENSAALLRNSVGELFDVSPTVVTTVGVLNSEGGGGGGTALVVAGDETPSSDADEAKERSLMLLKAAARRHRRCTQQLARARIRSIASDPQFIFSVTAPAAAKPREVTHTPPSPKMFPSLVVSMPRFFVFYTSILQSSSTDGGGGGGGGGGVTAAHIVGYTSFYADYDYALYTAADVRRRYAAAYPLIRSIGATSSVVTSSLEAGSGCTRTHARVYVYGSGSSDGSLFACDSPLALPPFSPAFTSSTSTCPPPLLRSALLAGLCGNHRDDTATEAPIRDHSKLFELRHRSAGSIFPPSSSSSSSGAGALSLPLTSISAAELAVEAAVVFSFGSQLSGGGGAATVAGLAADAAKGPTSEGALFPFFGIFGSECAAGGTQTASLSEMATSTFSLSATETPVVTASVSLSMSESISASAPSLSATDPTPPLTVSGNTPTATGPTEAATVTVSLSESLSRTLRRGCPSLCSNFTIEPSSSSSSLLLHTTLRGGGDTISSPNSGGEQFLASEGQWARPCAGEGQRGDIVFRTAAAESASPFSPSSTTTTQPLNTNAYDYFVDRNRGPRTATIPFERWSQPLYDENGRLPPWMRGVASSAGGSPTVTTTAPTGSGGAANSRPYKELLATFTLRWDAGLGLDDDSTVLEGPSAAVPIAIRGERYAAPPPQPGGNNSATAAALMAAAPLAGVVRPPPILLSRTRGEELGQGEAAGVTANEYRRVFSAVGDNVAADADSPSLLSPPPPLPSVRGVTAVLVPGGVSLLPGRAVLSFRVTYATAEAYYDTPLVPANAVLTFGCDDFGGADGGSNGGIEYIGPPRPDGGGAPFSSSSSSSSGDDDGRSRELVVTVFLGAPPAPSPIVPPPLAEAGAVVSLLSVGAGGGAAAADMQTLALLGLAECAKGRANSAAKSGLQLRMMSPTALDESSAGVIKGNFALVLGAGLAHFLAGCFVRFFIVGRAGTSGLAASVDNAMSIIDGSRLSDSHPHRHSMVSPPKRRGSEGGALSSSGDSSSRRSEGFSFAVGGGGAGTTGGVTASILGDPLLGLGGGSGGISPYKPAPHRVNMIVGDGDSHSSTVDGLFAAYAPRGGEAAHTYAPPAKGSGYAYNNNNNGDDDEGAFYGGGEGPPSEPALSKRAMWVKAFDRVRFPAISFMVIQFLQTGFFMCGVDVLRNGIGDVVILKSAASTSTDDADDEGDDNDGNGTDNNNNKNKKKEDASKVDNGESGTVYADEKASSEAAGAAKKLMDGSDGGPSRVSAAAYALGIGAMVWLALPIAAFLVISYRLASRAFYPVAYHLYGVWHAAAYVLLPMGQLDKTIPGTEMFASVVGRYRHPHPLLVLCAFASFVASAPIVIGKGDSCRAMYGLAAALHFAFAALLAFLKPFRVRLACALQPIGLALNGAVILLYIDMLEDPYAVRPTTAAALSVFLGAQTFLSAVRTLHTVLQSAAGFLGNTSLLPQLRPYATSCAWEVASKVTSGAERSGTTVFLLEPSVSKEKPQRKKEEEEKAKGIGGGNADNQPSSPLADNPSFFQASFAYSPYDGRAGGGNRRQQKRKGRKGGDGRSSYTSDGDGEGADGEGGGDTLSLVGGSGGGLPPKRRGSLLSSIGDLADTPSRLHDTEQELQKSEVKQRSVALLFPRQAKKKRGAGATTTAESASFGADAADSEEMSTLYAPPPSMPPLAQHAGSSSPQATKKLLLSANNTATQEEHTNNIKNNNDDKTKKKNKNRYGISPPSTMASWDEDGLLLEEKLFSSVVDEEVGGYNSPSAVVPPFPSKVMKVAEANPLKNAHAGSAAALSPSAAVQPTDSKKKAAGGGGGGGAGGEALVGIGDVPSISDSVSSLPSQVEGNVPTKREVKGKSAAGEPSSSTKPKRGSSRPKEGKRLGARSASRPPPQSRQLFSASGAGEGEATPQSLVRCDEYGIPLGI